MKDIERFLPENQITLEEPWIQLHGQNKIKDWCQEDRIKWNQTHRQREKYSFYIKAFDFISDNKIDGEYFEFGCHRVRTFRMALTEAYRHGLDDMKFLAFDSFKGLPPNDGDHDLGKKWNSGQLMTSEEQFWEIIREHDIYTNKIKTVPGFYNDTLNGSLNKELSQEVSRASFICVDCDLYDSAVPVFNFIDDFLTEGTVLYIDDYWAGYKGNPNKGVSLAFKEYMKKSTWHFVEYLDVGWAGKSFIVYN